MTAPAPTDVCDVCGALLAQREAAKDAGRSGEAGDCERELRDALDERTGVHTASVPPRPYDVSRSPVPVPGCEPCAELAARRAAARSAFDYSAVGDANVLMRTHQRLEHGT
ncbi:MULTISPECIES: hypothetical protein [unclassified Streptomyces]|uniref:hypothetical protein n=1 Tax=unclassified Streptomyces TaxID=2593676 RepID=UPI002258A5AC|nr:MULTISPECIES: hypothetical protein [unclassified Streptomyces]MCX5048663.1 hypothetical protein [Streptomyces sp. NBC_00474]